MRSLLFSLSLLTVAFTAQAQDIRSGLRTAALIVRDMDESLAFYRDVLGYRIVVEKRVTDATSIETVGLEGYDGFRLIYLKPNAEFPSRPFAASDISLVQPFGGQPQPRPTDPCAGKATRIGQIVMSQQVQGLDAIAANVTARGYCVVSSLRPSSTGQSRTLAVLDPNGIRVEMFEYVAK
jgi:catechol 2,3-dioxygenase-like lactoylglutathione lyase family enzyme